MRYLLYYAGFNNKTLEEQIGVVETKDFSTWNYLNKDPVIPIKKNGIYDSKQTSNPCVLKHNGLYKMWYQGKSDDGNLHICYSESKDGLSWGNSEPVFFINQNVGSGYREGYHHPHVVFNEHKNIFQMWYVVYKGDSVVFSYTESINGINWTESKDTNIVSNDKNIKYWYPFVLIEKNSYSMWFTKRSPNKIWSIHYASSNDGLSWRYDLDKSLINTNWRYFFWFIEIFTKIFNIYFEVPVYGIGSPFIWKENSKYFLLGHEVGPRGKLYISRYASSDGLNWKKIKNNILPRPQSDWNNFFQADPFLYVE